MSALLALILAGWSIVYGPTPSGPFTTVTNLTSASGFVKLQGPAGQSAAVGQALTITNASASIVVSNGQMWITLSPSLADWQKMSMAGMTANVTIVQPGQ